MISIINTIVERVNRVVQYHNQQTAILKFNADTDDNEVAIDDFTTKSFIVKATDAASFTLNLKDLFDVAELKYLSVKCFLEKLDATTANKTLPFTLTHDSISFDTACYELIDVLNMSATTYTITSIQGMGTDEVARVDVIFATKNS